MATYYVDKTLPAASAYLYNDIVVVTQENDNKAFKNVGSGVWQEIAVPETSLKQTLSKLGFVSSETNLLTGGSVISPGSAPIRQTIYSSFAPRSRISENAATDANFSVLHSVQMPALPGDNSTVIITPIWSYTNSASVKTLACRFGGSDIGAPTVTTSLTARHMYQVHNANSKLAQKTLNSSAGYLISNNALIQTSVDTSQPFTIEFRVKWAAAAASETITLEGVMIELVP